MTYPRKGRIRLVVDLPTDLYYALEKGAENANATITIYVVRALTDKFFQEGITISDSEREFLSMKIRTRRQRIYTQKRKDS